MFYHALTGNGGATPTEDLEPVLLWTNPSPRSDFATQTVSLDLTDYTGVIVEFNANTDTSNYTTCTRVFCKKGDPNYFGGGAALAGSTLGRVLQIRDEGVFFGEGFLATSKANGNAVPIKIYGVKEYVVEVDYGKHYVEWTAANSPYVLETDKPVQMIYFKSSSTASEYITAYLNDDGTYSSYGTGFTFTKINDTKIKIGYSSSSENFASGTFQVYYIV